MIPAVISAFTALCVTALTFYWTKRREREADWRKLKLDQYREYVAALSGIIGTRSSAEAQQRYSDAANSMTLVASDEVLKELYRFVEYTSYRNPSRSQARHDEILGALLEAMRADIDPASRPSKAHLAFKMIDVPPDAALPNPETRG